MAVQIRKATREELLGRMALIGVSGSGKTFTGIVVGMILAALKGKRLGVVDTENRSASKYVGEPCAVVPGGRIDFDVIELDSFHPDRYIEAIEAFEANEETGAILVDSLSHAWIGKDGVLEIKENAAKKRGNNDYTAWREASPVHNRLVEKLVRCRKHLAVCMRAKAEYAIQTNDVTKRTEVVKLGMAAEQRGGLEYEFDLVFDVDLKHNATASKTRVRALDGKVFDVVRESKAIADTFAAWLSAGEPRVEPPPLDVASWRSKLEAATTLVDLDAVALALAEAAKIAHTDPNVLAPLRALYDDRKVKIASGSSAPASSAAPAEAPKGEPLTPGVDVPSMDAKKPEPAPAQPAAASPEAAQPAPAPADPTPAAKTPTPREVAIDEILAAFEKSKTVADLQRFVAPAVSKNAPKLEKRDIDDARRMWNDFEAAIAKAGGRLP